MKDAEDKITLAPTILIPGLVGVLLVLAALLKAWDTTPAAAWFGNRNLDELAQLLQINVELLLAAGCFSGLAPKTIRRLLLLLFSCFAIYALYLVVAGAESCGCFGPVKVHPWVTFTLDITVLALLYCWNPNLQDVEKSPPSRRWTVFFLIYAALAMSTTTWMILHRPTVLAASSQLAESGGIVILDPESWIGQPLPIADHIDIDIGNRLTEGQWVVLLYHHNCPKCQEALPRYIVLAEKWQMEGNGGGIALIEVPPYSNQPLAVTREAVYGRLNDNKEWFVQAPMEIKLENGIVIGASLELPAVASEATTPSGKIAPSF